MSVNYRNISASTVFYPDWLSYDTNIIHIVCEEKNKLRCTFIFTLPKRRIAHYIDSRDENLRHCYYESDTEREFNIIQPSNYNQSVEFELHLFV
jgi:hypothetical protein